MDFLKQLKLDDLLNQKVKYLSGGQKQRVAIARELMKNPQVIFCDEPTSALDVKSAKIIMDILRTLSKTKTVIIVTHDTSFINEKDLVFELDKGELISTSENQSIKISTYKEPAKPFLTFKNAFHTAFINIKNKPERFCISVFSIIISSVLLLTTFSGAIENEGNKQFEDLFNTYRSEERRVGKEG